METEVGKYYLVFNTSNYNNGLYSGFHTVKRLDCCFGKQYQIHNTRIILDDYEIEEIIEEVEKPLFGTEY